MTSASRRELGFTLIEVLVALIVTSLLLSLIMNGAISGRDRHLRGNERRAAIAVARAVMEEAAAGKLDPGVRTGAEAGLRWSVEEDVRAADPRGLHALVRLKVEVRSRRGVRLFNGETFKLKTAGAV